MRKILVVLIVIISFISCSKNNKIDQVTVDKNIYSKSISGSLVDSEIKLTDEDRKIMKEKIIIYTGTYLPVKYIEELKKVKSHLKASKILDNKDVQYANAIMIKENKLMKIFNFHEGIGENIIKFNQDLLITENGDLMEYKILNNDTIYDQNMEYKKISSASDNNNIAVSKFIVNTILGLVDLKNETTEFKTFENGNIQYMGKIFKYGVGLVFTSDKYDYMSIKNELRYLEILPNNIKIFTAKIPDEDVGDPFGIINAEYIIENEFDFNK